MPRMIMECQRCHRQRDFGKLDVERRDGTDGTEEDHYLFVCANGCIPTRWEARRERKAELKAARELQAWVTSKEKK